MEVTIETRNVELTPHLEDYVEKKVGKLDRYLPDIEEAFIELSTDHRKQTNARPVAQLTIRHRRGPVLRAEDKKQKDIYAAVDSVLDKMYRQIRSFKGKRRRRGVSAEEEWFRGAEPLPLPALSEQEEEALEAKMEIVRRKRIPLTPIDEIEAMERIEELDHDFYMFLNAATGKINVIYRREEGNYGLLEPAE
ncbi:MAG: ribosome-associated translation inhibitor RaiA [Anaerolineae bacterium]